MRRFPLCGETPTWPIPAYAKPQTGSILYVCANGQEEWDGTWYRHVRPNPLNRRATTGWLAHQTVARGVGHGNYTDAHGSKGWGQPVPKDTLSVLRVWGRRRSGADGFGSPTGSRPMRG